MSSKFLLSMFLFTAMGTVAAVGADPAVSAVSATETVDSILARIKAPEFPNRDFAITDYGAEPDKDCTEAIRKAIAACHEAGGGRVIVPKGTFLTGAVHMKGNVNLHIAEGATLKFHTESAKYPIVHTRFEGVECMNYSPLIYSYAQDNVALTGKGTLDGSATYDNWLLWKSKKKGEALQQPSRKKLFKMGEDGMPVEQRVMGDGHFLRPSFIQFYKGKNVLIENVTILRSPMWVIHPVLCTNVTVRGVTVRSLGYNNDGCDPESCRDVLIENCTFKTGDDCIAIKSGRNNDARRIAVPAENIVIRNCHMENGHGGMTIGSEISGGARNIFAENLTMDSPNLKWALRFKNNARRGALVENIHFRNIKIGTVGRSVVAIEHDYEEGGKGPHQAILRNVVIENVSTESAGQVFYVGGYPGSVIEDVVVRNSVFKGVKNPDTIKKADTPILENVTVEMAPTEVIKVPGN